jgi:hypothetical protein
LPVHESSDRIRRAMLPLIAVVAAFAWVIIPFESAAEITVEPPTGSADPTLMEKLRVSVETVASGAATAYGVDGRLLLSVDTSGEDVTLAFELVLSDGSAPVRESRTVERESAAAEVRAVARAMIRAVAERRSGTVSQDSEGSKESPQPERDWPALDSPYSRKKALWLSLGPTLGGVVLGGTLIGPAFAIENDSGRVAMLGIGVSITGLAFIIGPSLGHFWVKNNKQAVLGLVLRTVFSAAAPVLFNAGFWTGWSAGMGGEGSSGAGTAFFVFGALSSAVGLTWAIVDLATVRRAAQRANEKAAAEKEADAKISNVSFAPLFAPGPNGSTTAGFAFSMRF